LEESFDKELPGRLYSILDAKYATQASQGDAREANAKVVQMLVLMRNKNQIRNLVKEFLISLTAMMIPVRKMQLKIVWILLM